MKIDDPAALRTLAVADLPSLAAELRDELIQTVASSGGHLASGLGTIELAVALHYVYDTPRDALVWDVGHQAYPHKMLTGRREKLSTIRRRGGISGFLKRDESPHDAFGAGHSSTSISAALGIAVANRRLGLNGKAVAIIGDGHSPQVSPTKRCTTRADSVRICSSSSMTMACRSQRTSVPWLVT